MNKEKELLDRQQLVVNMARECKDPIVLQVCQKLLGRSIIGLSKYNETLETNKLSQLEWLKHAQEEALDFSNYLQKLQSIIHREVYE